MTNALSWVMQTLTDTFDWLLTWRFQGVSFGFYLIGFAILSILITRLFN